MTCELVVVDCFGQIVALDHSNWQKHLPIHPEMVAYHQALPDVLTGPDVVIRADRDGQYHYYRRGLTSGRFENSFIHVVVGFPSGDAKIMTTWLQSTISTKGTVLWPANR